MTDEDRVEDEVVAVCSSGHDVFKSNRHCGNDSPTCSWYRCKEHKPSLVIDPGTGREFQ